MLAYLTCVYMLQYKLPAWDFFILLLAVVGFEVWLQDWVFICGVNT